MRNRKVKRLLAVLMAMSMTASLCGTSAFATEVSDTDTEITTEITDEEEEVTDDELVDEQDTEAEDTSATDGGGRSRIRNYC